jgi:hypothetical protein
MNKVLTLFFCCLVLSAFAGTPVTIPTTGGYCIPDAELAPIRGGGGERVLSRKLKSGIIKGNIGHVSALFSCNYCQGSTCEPWTFQITDTEEVMQILNSSCPPQQLCNCSDVSTYLSKYPSTASYATRLRTAYRQGFLPNLGCGNKKTDKKNSLEEDVEEYLFE